MTAVTGPKPAGQEYRRRTSQIGHSTGIAISAPKRRCISASDADRRGVGFHPSCPYSHVFRPRVSCSRHSIMALAPAAILDIVEHIRTCFCRLILDILRRLE
jgi:hypothetical protein